MLSLFDRHFASASGEVIIFINGITHSIFFKEHVRIYYIASISSGEMADCHWLRSTFSCPLLSGNLPLVPLGQERQMCPRAESGGGGGGELRF